MAAHVRAGKGHKEFGRRVRQPDGGGKTRGKRRVHWEHPEDRCACHHTSPCPSRATKKV